MIDANLKTPDLTRICQAKGVNGLAELLSTSSNDDGDSTNAVKSTVIRIGNNLHLLPAGKSSAQHRLDSIKGESIIAVLEQEYDILLFDSPSFVSSADSLAVASLADGLLFVIRAGFLDRQTIADTIERLQLSHINIIGAVLNRFK
jgi:non-specific protein-tyrosine kinase